MTDQLISFETAKLAKEKGFSSYSDCAYLGTKHIESGIDMSNENHKEDSWCEAPTQSLLQRWLREEHWIHVVPECRSSAGLYFVWIFKMHSSSTHTKTGKGATAQRIGNYQLNYTYEEALEIGLQEALKLIK
jgi:hypothetical protein